LTSREIFTPNDFKKIIYESPMDEKSWEKPSKCEAGSKILESLL
jgi:hypothetical protein